MLASQPSVQRAFVRAELIRRLQHNLVRPELARDPPLFADLAHVPFPTAQAPRRKILPGFDERAATPARLNRCIFPSSRCQHSVVCYTNVFP